ncbi:MAG: universal stress protein [Luteolibacter sp.]
MNTPTPAIARPTKILLATDLSCRCDRALDRTTICADYWKARMVVATVVDQEVLAKNWLGLSKDPVGGGCKVEAMREARRLLAEDLVSIGLHPEVRVRSGDVLEEVLAMSKEDKADLVVTGVARNNWLRSAVLGTVVDGLMKHSEVPVLVVRKRARVPYRRILIAGDLSDLSRVLLRHALAWFPDAEIGFFHAVEVLHANLADTGRGELQQQAFRVAQNEIVAFLDSAGLASEDRKRVKVHCEIGSPVEALNDCLKRDAIDLVVVGAHGRGLLFEIFVGSNAKQIVENIPADVLVIRSTDS